MCRLWPPSTHYMSCGMNTRCLRGHAEGLQNLASASLWPLIARPGDDGAGEQDYVKGEVQGYLPPWWRMAYSDESW